MAWFTPLTDHFINLGWSTTPQVTGRRVEAIQQTAELVTAAGGEGVFSGWNPAE